MEKEEKIPKEPKRESLEWSEFTQNTTFHGVKYIFVPEQTKIRRILWVVCVLLAIGLFLGQVFARTMDYFEYKSTVNFEVIYPDDSIPFPAITICNQNNYRMTSAISMDLYYLIDEIFSVKNTSGKDFPVFPKIPVEDFITRIAHQREDLIDRCYWQGQPCDMDDFKVILTDLGVCYTFNSNFSQSPLMVSESGSGQGLSLVMNVEQYEYMKGPQNDAGITILLHNQSEIPQMKDQGFSVAPGMHTTIGVKRIQVESLWYPYGKCERDSDPVSVCLSECKMKKILKNCSCWDISYGSFNFTNGPRVCSLQEHFTCVRSIRSKTFETKDCKCPIPCEKIQYEPSLSYAQLSKFNIERMVLTDQDKKDKIERKFLHAREKSHANILEYVTKDQAQTKDLLNAMEALSTILNKNQDILVSHTDFAKRYKTIDIIGNGGQIMKTDNIFEDIFNDRIKDIRDNVERLVSSVPAFIKLNDMENRLERNFLKLQPSTNESGLLMIIQTCMAEKDMGYDQTTWLPAFTSEPITDSNSSTPVQDEPERVCIKKVYDNLKHIVQDYAGQDFKSFPKNARKKYEEDIGFVFGNTSRNVSVEYPEHGKCLQLLTDIQAEVYMGQILEIQHFISTWGEGIDVKPITDFYAATEKMAHKFFSGDFSTTFDLINDIKTTCQWMMKFALYHPIEGRQTIEKEIIKLMRVQSRSSMKGDFSNVMIYFGEIVKVYEKMKQLENGILSILETNVKNFQRQNITKSELALVFEKPSIIKSLDALSVLSTEFDGFALEYEVKLQAVEVEMKNNYLSYFTFALPWINSTTIENFELIKSLKKLQKDGKLDEKLNQSLAMLHENYQENMMNLIGQIFEPWLHLVVQQRTNLTMIIEQQLMNSFQDLAKNLKKYITENQIDDKFFLENFLQVDIYYRELSYEKIEQQVSFKLLSLFSEIGGFLGLLLGASVLTMCELVDYLVQLCTTRVKPKANKTGLA